MRERYSGYPQAAVTLRPAADAVPTAASRPIGGNRCGRSGIATSQSASLRPDIASLTPMLDAAVVARFDFTDVLAPPSGFTSTDWAV